MSFTKPKFLGPGMAISTAKKPFNWFPGPNGLAGSVRAGQSQAQWRRITTLEKTAFITGIAGQDGSYLADKTEASYQPGDMLEKRAKLIAEWEKFCSTIEPIGMVVPIRRSTQP